MIGDNDYYWYKLYCANGIGPKSLHKIYNVINKKSLDVSLVFEMNERELRTEFGMDLKTSNSLKKLNDQRCHQDYENIKQKQIHIIHIAHEHYPEKVRSRMGDSTPPLLFCGGNISLLNSASVSIVGSRNASEKELSLTKDLTKELVYEGKNIVSGYAKGIDTFAHLTALENNGTTTFVLSYGIFKFSWKREFSHINRNENFLAVSQFSPQLNWQARNAMIRNKLVVSLADGVVVIKSGSEKNAQGQLSGTFDTASTALKLDIPLFVLSSSLLEAPAEGNSELIRNGGIEITLENAVKTISEVILNHNSGLNTIKNLVSDSQLTLDFIKDK